MDDEYSSSTDVERAQESFTALPIYQQIYIADLVLGPAAAVTLARRHNVDLVRYDWWSVALTS
jgi:hypothetical protein